MIIIDGYNLLYKRGDMQEEVDLLTAIYDYCRYFNKRAIVVFDGEWDYAGEDDTYELQIKYVKNADDIIMQLAKKYPRSTIITSDREIIQRVRQFNCQVIKSQDFNPSVPVDEENKPQNIDLSDDDVQKYLDWFTTETE